MQHDLKKLNFDLWTLSVLNIKVSLTHLFFQMAHQNLANEWDMGHWPIFWSRNNPVFASTLTLFNDVSKDI